MTTPYSAGSRRGDFQGSRDRIDKVQRKNQLGLRRYREEPGVYWRSGFEIVGVCVVDCVFVPFYVGRNEEQAKLLGFFFEDFVSSLPSLSL
jgi:hypothetical protein